MGQYYLFLFSPLGLKEYNMPLIQKILNYMKLQTKEVHLSEIYDRFRDIKPTTIRGRINE